MSNVVASADQKIGISKLILSALIAVIVSFGLILIFAMLIKWLGGSDSVITPVNVVIKLISIAVGVIIATKNGGRGLIKGIAVGAIYIIFSYVAFSALLGSFSLGLGNLWDLLFGVVSGGIIGIISNIIKK